MFLCLTSKIGHILATEGEEKDLQIDLNTWARVASELYPLQLRISTPLDCIDVPEEVSILNIAVSGKSEMQDIARIAAMATQNTDSKFWKEYAKHGYDAVVLGKGKTHFRINFSLRGFLEFLISKSFAKITRTK